MTKYSIIALDLDGTLTRDDKTISEYTRDVLIDAQKKGLKVVLASGRPTNGMAFIADELRMDEFGGTVLSFNGGIIMDWSTKNILSKVILPIGVLPLLYNFSKEKSFSMMTYCDKEIITEDVDNEYVMRSAYRNRMEVKIVDSFLDAVKEWGDIPKCMIVGEPERLATFEEELKIYAEGRTEFEGIDFFRSEPYYLEIVPQGIDKGVCLQIILDYYGLKREELIACGDAYNDLGMISYAGLGVAMGNALECVKEIADYVTESNEADGVAKVVEKFFLSLDIMG